MDLNMYKREIDLMKRQNYTECDMYSIIAALIREGENVKSLSIRDVHTRRKSELGQVFYGLSGIPDLVVLHPDFNNSDNIGMNVSNIEYIFGCIEIKRVNDNLLSVFEILNKISEGNKGIKLSTMEGQLLGEVLWYKNVIYTNGIRWRYYKCESDDEYIQNLVEARIEKEEHYRTENNISRKKSINLKELDWYKQIDVNKLKINEIKLLVQDDTKEEPKDINDINEDQWKRFVAELHSINWNRN